MPYTDTINDLLVLLKGARDGKIALRNALAEKLQRFKSGMISSKNVQEDLARNNQEMKKFDVKIDKLQKELDKKIMKLPEFSKKGKFSNMSKDEIQKLERFYEIAYDKTISQGKEMGMDFETMCKYTADNYDGITELYGDSFPEAFGPSEKFSSVFVNMTLSHMGVTDCKTGEPIQVNTENLKTCSYSLQEAKAVDIAMMGSNDLERFNGLITVSRDSIVATVDAIQNKVAEDPELDAYLDKSEIKSISENVISKLDGIDTSLKQKLEEFAYERTAVVSTSYGNMRTQVKKTVGEIFNELSLPTVSDTQFPYEFEGEKYWLSEDGKIYSESEMQDKYNTQIQDTEVEINVLP